MELTEEQEEGHGGFDLVLKELVRFQSKESNHHSGFDRVLRELMAEREKAAVEKAVAADRKKQQSELMAEREKAAVATVLLKQQEETARKLANQQNDFQQQLQKQQEEFQAKIEQEKRSYQVQLEKHQERLEHERREHKDMQDHLLARQDQLLSSQDQERKEERRRQEEEKKEERRHQERQQAFFREVIQQLQDEVKVLRHNGGAHLISGTQGEVETPGKHGTTASSSPYSMTPLSLMMETPNKPFEDTIGGGEVIANFAAGDSGSVDETNNYVENDAVEEEEPTKITKSDQGSVVLSDEDQRAKGLVTFEEAFLLNKIDYVGSKVERAEQVGHHLSSNNLAQSRPLRKSMKLKLTKANMKMIAGKLKLTALLIREMGNIG